MEASQPFASAGVENHCREERKACRDQKGIEHEKLLLSNAENRLYRIKLRRCSFS
jgi:hypothetical protein